MKPTKNRVFCEDCGKPKMLFKTEKKAETFIKFNSDEIEEESGYKPERSYFCAYCGGWHITSQKEYLGIKSRTEKILELYRKQTEERALMKAKLQALKKKEAAELLLAQKKKEEALLLAQKRKEEASLLAEKKEYLKKSLNKVEEYIAILEYARDHEDKYVEILSEKYVVVSEKRKENKDEYIEIFNKALAELENAKLTIVVYEKKEERIKSAEEKLITLKGEIEKQAIAKEVKRPKEKVVQENLIKEISEAPEKAKEAIAKAKTSMAKAKDAIAKAKTDAERLAEARTKGQKMVNVPKAIEKYRKTKIIATASRQSAKSLIKNTINVAKANLEELAKLKTTKASLVELKEIIEEAEILGKRI